MGVSACDFLEMGNPLRSIPLDAVPFFVQYIASSSDSDILGVTSVFVKELRGHPLYRNLYGDATVSDDYLKKDSYILLGRVLHDLSACNGKLESISLKKDLEKYAGRGDEEDLDNWKKGQRDYVKDGLDYLLGMIPGNNRVFGIGDEMLGFDGSFGR